MTIIYDNEEYRHLGYSGVSSVPSMFEGGFKIDISRGSTCSGAQCPRINAYCVCVLEAYSPIRMELFSLYAFEGGELFAFLSSSDVCKRLDSGQQLLNMIFATVCQKTNVVKLIQGISRNQYSSGYTAGKSEVQDAIKDALGLR